MRKLLYCAVALVLALAAISTFIHNTAAGQDALFSRAAQMLLAPAPPIPDGLRVVVCGSASPAGNDPDRAQACIAVLTPEHFFLVDVGARSPQRIAQARLPMGRLDGVLLTHFHSDHIAGLADVNLASWVQGRRSSLKVHGPKGVGVVVAGFNLAYSLDRGYRVAHHGPQLLAPPAGPMTAVESSPGDVVWQDGLMTIRSFPVDHAPIDPAVGYRLDYRGRSVVVSGDTNAVDSLFAAAQGADLLLHDALSRALLDPMIEATRAAGNSALSTILTDVIDYHADSLGIEARAAEAGIRQLAYYHLVPVPANALARRMFARGLDPGTLLVRDLHTFDLPPNSTEIRIHEP